MLPKISLSSSENNLEFNFSNEDNNHTSDFERKMEKYLETRKKVVALNSGTSAIHTALILSGVGENDEVLCQDFTYIATINPIIYQGATPIFIDSDKDTWNMCPVYLEKAIKDRISIGKKPKAIIFVHIYGMPAKIDEIYEISRKYNIMLIEDAAESLGSEFKGEKCGTFGDYSILSFNNNKIITTFGGGALVSKTNLEKEKAIFLATQARENKVHYEHSIVGYNYRMSDVISFIGCRQLEYLEKNIKLRRANNIFYKEIFRNVKGVEVLSEPTNEYFSNHWLSCVIIDKRIAGFSNEELRLRFLKDNIESRPLWKPMHLQPVFNNCCYYGRNVAVDLYKNGLCLPSGSNLTYQDKLRIRNSINMLLNR
jgi:dTDP-4-amino-4,6-dideoxygalactose transaminase